MPRKANNTAANGIMPRLRVVHGDEIALGPGKVRLLELVNSTGSIAQAAKQMGMSYMRAWTLIRTMNRCFRAPLVVSVRGGTKGGGAQVTDAGREALALYQSMERQFVAAADDSWKRLSSMLAD